MPMTASRPPQVPSPAVWHGIEQRLRPAPAAAAAPPWWHRLSLWRSLSGAALAAVVGLALLAATPPLAQAPVVVLQSSDKAPALAGGSIVASFSGDGRAAVARTLMPVLVQAARVLELWCTPEQGESTSLGLIRAGGVRVLSRGQLPGGLRGSGIDQMALSVEPPGGSSTGQPTKPAVFCGKLQL